MMVLWDMLKQGVTPIGVAFLFCPGVMRMYKLHDNDKDKKKLKRKKEKMSWRDWLDVMGVRRDTYKRVRGAIRRK